MGLTHKEWLWCNTILGMGQIVLEFTVGSNFEEQQKRFSPISNYITAP